MSQNLTNKYVVDTYDGILHTEASIPSTGRSAVYDGLGNRTDIDVGRYGQGVTINNLQVGSLTYPKSTTTTNYVVAASNSSTLTMKNIDDILPDDGPSGSGGNYPLGDIRNISVDSKGRVTNVATITSPQIAKDMGRLRVQTSPTILTYENYTLSSGVWNKLTFAVDSGSREDRTYKAGIFYIERSSTGQADFVPGTTRANIRASMNPVWDTGSGITYDPQGHRCLKVDSGRMPGAQFFSALSAHPTDNSVVIYIKDDGNTNSQWNISLQAVHY